MTGARTLDQYPNRTG